MSERIIINFRKLKDKNLHCFTSEITFKMTTQMALDCHQKPAELGGSATFSSTERKECVSPEFYITQKFLSGTKHCEIKGK